MGWWIYPPYEGAYVDYGKVTAGLRRALESPLYGGEEPLAIFIELADPPSEEQIALLREAGVTSSVEGLDIITAELTREGIEFLSEQPWVMAMTLSGTLRPLPL
jgi:hypothetical protein